MKEILVNQIHSNTKNQLRIQSINQNTSLNK